MPKEKRNVRKGHRIPAGGRTAAGILCLRGEEMSERGIDSQQEGGWLEGSYA